ncbi:hypothetical protein ACQRAV_00170 [Segatella copri]
MFLLRKDGRIVASLYLVVTDMIYDDGGFLLQNQAAYPSFGTSDSKLVLL